MYIQIIVGLIILGLMVLFLVLLGSFCLGMYAVASGISYKNKTEASAWDYWETMKHKSWFELSDEEKERLILANLVIANDIGAVVTKGQLIKMLEEQLPIMEPRAGLSYTIGY